MSEGTFPSPGSAPPPKKSGSKTVIIVIVVLLLLIAICCGGCLIAGPMLGLSVFSKAAALFTEPVMNRIVLNDEVKEALGEPLTAGLPTKMENAGGSIAIEFPVTGPKGTAQVQAQLSEGPNGVEPKSIRVIPSAGNPIDVPTATDPENLTFPDFDAEMEGSEPE